MISSKALKEVEIVYFTGTGSTRIVADQLAASFSTRGVKAVCHEINYHASFQHQKTGLMIIIYPVYALNAPWPVYEFIEHLTGDLRCPAVVISVSGGGEVTPNKACRLHAIQRLQKKGYPVIYEQMIVMPSNFLVATPQELSVRLLEVLPLKTDYIADELLAGVRRRTRPDLFNQLLSCIGELEKSAIASKTFSRHMSVSNRCNGCGICLKGCPVKNISLVNGRPVFKDHCTICLKCIYQCPRKAIQPKYVKFFVLKQGYPLQDWMSKINGAKKHTIEELAKGYAYSGIKKYLKEDMD